jgi:hypothetical protein
MESIGKQREDMILTQTMRVMGLQKNIRKRGQGMIVMKRKKRMNRV